jgi:multidrug efflux pump subunit AcrB
MSLSDLSIKNPVFAVMLSAAMIVFGYLGYRDMGVSQFPEIDFPVVSIVITREAASPDIMDGDVTDVVEDAVAGVEGVDYIMSQSLEGTSITTVFFKLNRNIDVAMQDVQNAVSAARRRLPLDIDPPVISKVNPNNLPVIWLTLSGPVPRRLISDFAEKEFKQQLAAIPEVGGVQFAGLQARNIRIWVDRDKLTSFNLAADDVKKAIQDQHAELPAGYIKSNRVEFNLRTMGEAYSVEEFKKLLLVQRGNQQVYLGDVATIEDGLEDQRSLARFNRMPAVAVGVRKAIGGNLVAVCENVKKELPRLRRTLPKGVDIHVPVDTSLFVRENVEELKLTLLLGIVLTAVVCFLFLGSLGTTINICLSIPTSLVGTFFFANYGMKVIGMQPFTINLMTLLALSLSVGVVVDDAILVLENIYRHREMGKGRKEGALIGAREITFAAIAATLSIMAIFLPVAFMTGTIGKFFFQFGVTVGIAVLLSLVCALTLTPMLCAFFLNLHNKEHRLPAGYSPTLLACFVVVLAVSGAAGFLAGWETGLAILCVLVTAQTLIALGVAMARKQTPPAPLPVAAPLAAVVGVLVLLGGCSLRLAAMWQKGLAVYAWPVLSLWESITEAIGVAWMPQTTLARWAIECAAEFLVVALLVRYAGLLYWVLDRFFLEPTLLRPTDWALRQMDIWYFWFLKVSLRHWGFILLVSLLLILVAVGFLYFDVLGRELVPSEDQSRLLVHIICPVGSSIDQVSDLLARCEAKLVEREEVGSLLTTVATESGQLMNEADIFVQLVPQDKRNLTQQQLMILLRNELREIEDIRVVVRDQSTEGFTAQRGDPIDFVIQGDWNKLPGWRLEILEQMKSARNPRNPDWPLLEDIDTDYRPGMPEVRIRPDREKLSLVNMSVNHLADSISLLVGGARVAKFTDRGRRYDVRVRMREQERATPDSLKLMTLRAGNNQLVNVGDVVESIDILPTLPVINRYNHQRKIEITANPAPGVSQGEAIETVEKIIKEVLPEEAEHVEMGNARAMRETINSLVFALLMGIIIAYMILGVQFNSFVHPLTVLLAMPFAVTGAVVTLWLTHDTLNMMSMIGLILLMGLVKKNSIILVDYTNQLREEGMGLEQAILKACPVRLRPILMTSVATVAGAVPAALGWGPGAETRAPMARGIIGGIVLSTLVTLILVPVFYMLVERMRAASGKVLTVPAEDDGQVTT